MSRARDDASWASMRHVLEVLAVFGTAALLSAVASATITIFAPLATAALVPFVLLYVGAYGVLGTVAGVFLVTIHGASYLDLRPPSLFDVRDVLVVFVGAVLLTGIVAGVGHFAGLPVVDPGTVGEPVDGTLLAAAIPLATFVGVPAQELLFRNACQKRLAESFPTWVAIGLSTVLMVLFTLASFVGAPILGLLVPALAVAIASIAIGLVYARTESLIAAWLLHSALLVALLSLLYLDATTALELSSLV